MALGALVLNVLSAVASEPEIPDIIPYTGMVEFDGQPISVESLPIRIELFPSPIGGDPVFTQTFSPAVASGAFTVLIGPEDDEGGPLRLVLQSVGELYIEVAVTDGEGGWIVLGNRQRLLAVPFAIQQSVQMDLRLERGIEWEPLVEGEAAWIRYLDEDEGDTVLEIGVSNDPHDDIRFVQNEETTLQLVDGEVHVTNDFEVGGGATFVGNLTAPNVPYNFEVSDTYTQGVGANRAIVHDQVMVSATDSVCFLTGTYAIDDNDEDDYGLCQIFESGGLWILRAGNNANDGNGAVRRRGGAAGWCQARCISWR